MSKILLPAKWVQYLIEQPESGMGYHLVDVTFTDNTEAKGCTVSNSEFIDLPKKDLGKTILAMSLTS